MLGKFDRLICEVIELDPRQDPGLASSTFDGRRPDVFNPLSVSNSADDLRG